MFCSDNKLGMGGDEREGYDGDMMSYKSSLQKREEERRNAHTQDCLLTW